MGIGLFNSIMFPTIFSLAIKRLGVLTVQGSSLLIMAIVGGAIIPILQTVVANARDVQISYVVPIVCYGYIMYYGYKGYAVKRSNPEKSGI